MHLYVSWARGLPWHPRALDRLGRSPAIAGVELSENIDQARAIKDAGLQVSIHNPVRKRRIGLVDAGFEEEVQRDAVKELCAIADSPVIGFHITSPRTAHESDEYLLERCVQGLEAAQEAIRPHQVAFETLPYFVYENMPWLLRRLRDGTRWDFPGPEIRSTTHPAFIEKLLSRTPAGVVFDVAHMYIASRENASYASDRTERLLDDAVRATKGRVVQLHLNAPLGTPFYPLDRHGTLYRFGPMSKRMFSLAEKVLEANPDLEIVTLEMAPSLGLLAGPLGHATSMAQQAAYVSKRLGLSYACKSPNPIELAQAVSSDATKSI